MKLANLIVYFSFIFSSSSNKVQSSLNALTENIIRHYQQEANYRNAAAGNAPVHSVNCNINKGGIPLKKLNCVRIKLDDTPSDKDLITRLIEGQFVLEYDNENTIFMSNMGSELNALTNTKESSN